jgi:hypothetical protein
VQPHTLQHHLSKEAGVGINRNWIAELRLSVTFFSNYAASSKLGKVMTMTELAALIRDTEAKAETVVHGPAERGVLRRLYRQKLDT